MDDSKIIDLFLKRDENAIEHTRQKYGGLCYSVAYNILRDPEDSEEAVNDTYLGVWNAIPPHTPVIFSSFIARITRNISLKIWRYKHADKRQCNVTDSLNELGECIPESDNVESVLECKELGEHIDRFLRTLKDRERVIFLRRYWYCDSVREIADKLDIGESKVKMQLMRTRQKLRSYFEKEGIDI